MLVKPNKERVAYLDNSFEADLLRQALQQEGIPALIQSNESNAYGDLFQSQHGWGAVYADLAQHEKIQALLQEIRSAAAAEQAQQE
ncbi:MAG TPA: DUF2007 domain-containing protein [Candidatus Avidehalobacter gallistercoris]|uniref:DUF2007 domain-containing protein n=1 Tax=Candidatus Avidehalobacter gallistercoris TaxID=2840694 RepID=A0A9D1HKR0_9FIRM|nr:DUF2007 domain-containing protein [Candidatus Avidehalobacter gallistercoris]